MKKLIIHIGYPKTATTTMQLNLFGQLHKDRKIEYLNHLNIDRDGLGEIPVKHIISHILGIDFSDNLKEELDRLLEIKNPISIISSESISHVCEESLKASIKVGALDNAKKINKILCPYFDKIEILMTVRNQKSIIPSYYAQEYFNIIGDNIDFKDFGKWLEINFGKNMNEIKMIFNYNEMYKSYLQEFGKDNVHILVYEDLIHDNKFFYNELAKIFNEDPKIIQNYFEQVARNVTIKSHKGEIKTNSGSIGNFLSMQLNNMLGKAKNINWVKKAKMFLRFIIPGFLLNLTVYKNVQIRRLNESEKQFLDLRFQPSNLKLVIDGGLDKEKMARYGYI